MKKRYLLFMVSFLLLAILIYYSDPQKVFNALLQANPIYILLGISFWFLGSLVRTYRWKYFLHKINIDINFPAAYKLYVTGLFLSNLTPAKSGDPARIYLLKKSEDESFSKGLSTIFLERVLDLIALISISVLGLLFLTAYLKISLTWIYIAIGIYSSIMVLGIYILTSKERTKKIAGKFVSLFSFIDKIKSLEGRVEEFSEKINRSLKMYREKKTLLMGILLTYLVWILGGITLYMAFRSIGISIPIHLILVIKSTVILISVLTFLPGSLGSGDILSVTLYSGFTDISVSLLTTGKIIGRLVNFWMYAIIGYLLLIFVFKKFLKDK